MVSLDRLFIPDDTYYTLTIARSMAHGGGPCVTPGLLTSGFQPLIAFLEIPAFWLFGNAMDAPIWWAVCIGVLADVATVVMLWRVCRRWGGDLAGGMAGSLWALSPVAVANALGGLETSLAILLWLGVIDVYDRALAAGGRNPNLNALLGVLCALALVARIDSALLLLALVLHSVGKGLSPRAYLQVLITALVSVSPWWWYELSRFGTVIPESGMAVRAQIGFHKVFGLTMSKQVGWAMGYLASVPGMDSAGFREFLGSHRAWAWVLFSLLGGGLVWGVRWGWKRNASSTLWLGSLAVLLFYAFYLPALWFFRRYLSPVELSVVVGLSLGCAGLLRSKSAILKVVGAGLATTHLLLGAWQLGSWMAHQKPFDRGYSGAKGYRTPARMILEALPPRARLGALQSGALSYFAPHWAPPGVEVVNLDGVVNHDAYVAIRQSRLKSYIWSQGLDHFADWRFNYHVVARAAAGDPREWAPRLLTASPPQGAQGQDQFLLSALIWPPAKNP